MPGVTTLRQKFVGRTAAVGAGAGQPNVGATATDEDVAIDDDDDETTLELMVALVLDKVVEAAEEVVLDAEEVVLEAKDEEEEDWTFSTKKTPILI
jgi:hypothetical protein